MSGRVAPGWYPDYEAPPGHQRFWDGERWTERRSSVPTRRPGRQVVGWVGAGLAALVIVVVAVLVLNDDDTPSQGSGSTRPPASTSSSSAPPSPSSSPTSDAEPGQLTWEVASALDDGVLQLVSGAQVRLVGVSVDGACATSALADLVEGQVVTMTTPGADKDAEGRLLRYVERDGVDVGLRLIQRGLANASDDANPRRAIYRRVDDRSSDVC